MLISKFDSHDAPNYLWMTPGLYHRHPTFVKSADGGSIVQDVFGSLVGNYDYPLHRGTSFIACVSYRDYFIKISQLTRISFPQTRSR